MVEQNIENIENLVQKLSNDLDILNIISSYLWENGQLEAIASKTKNKASAKFALYFGFKAFTQKIPHQKMLALFRAKNLNALKLRIGFNDFDKGVFEILKLLDQKLNEDYQEYFQFINSSETFAPVLKKLLPQVQKLTLQKLKRSADEKAIKAFGQTLQKLLTTKPVKDKVILGIDCSSFGVKGIVLDKKSNVLDSVTVFPKNQRYDAIATFARLAVKYNINLISLGNSNGWREIDRLISELISMYPDLKLDKLIVNDAGANAYANSEIGKKEYPQMDIGFRKAISIAKRVQDPPGELLKINLKFIEVNSFQKDVNQKLLVEHFEQIVKQCRANKQNLHKGLKIKSVKQPELRKKAIFNTSMRDALQRLTYGEK